MTTPATAPTSTCPEHTEWEWGNLAVATGKFIAAHDEVMARFWADKHQAPLARRCVGPVQLVKD